MEMNGLYHVGTLAPLAREAERWRAATTERLRKEMSVQVYPDGAQYDSRGDTRTWHCRDVLGIYGLAGPTGKRCPRITPPVWRRCSPTTCGRFRSPATCRIRTFRLRQHRGGPRRRGRAVSQTPRLPLDSQRRKAADPARPHQPLLSLGGASRDAMRLGPRRPVPRLRGRAVQRGASTRRQTVAGDCRGSARAGRRGHVRLRRLKTAALRAQFAGP